MNQTNQIKDWANPSPAGLVALAVSCFGFFALLSGRITSDALPLFGCWLLGGFVVQVIVGLIDLKTGNTTGGNTFVFFSAFFMLVGGLEMLIKFNMAHNNIKLDGHIDGWAWLVLAIVMLLWTPAFFKSQLVLTLIIIALDVSLPFIAFMDLELISRDFANIPAWGLLAAGVLGIYLSAGIVVNTAFGKKIYPLPGPICK